MAISETREEWVDKMSADIVDTINQEEEDRLSEIIGFSMEDGNPSFDEDAFVEFCGDFGGTLVGMLSRLNTDTGFSSTVQTMSFNDIVLLANEICSHVGAKLLCRLCDREEKK